MKHKDCKYFDKGTCVLKNVSVPAEGQVCRAFKPKEEDNNA